MARRKHGAFATREAPQGAIRAQLLLPRSQRSQGESNGVHRESVMVFPG